MQADATTARLGRVETWTDYREALRELHSRCGGPKYGTLSASSGLAKSAISGLIGTNPVQRPPEGTSLRFVEACLAHAHTEPDRVTDAVGVWRETWQRLKIADEGPLVGTPAPAPETLTQTPSGPPTGSGRRLAALAALATVTVTAVVAIAWLAQAAPHKLPPAQHVAAGAPVGQCVEAEADQLDVRTGHRWDSVYVCPTDRAMVYQWAAIAGTPIAVLRTNPSWIVCWTRGQRVAGSDVWYYTQGDDLLGMDALDSWGFISATDVAVTRHPDPGIERRCSFPTGPS